MQRGMDGEDMLPDRHPVHDDQQEEDSCSHLLVYTGRHAGPYGRQVAWEVGGCAAGEMHCILAYIALRALWVLKAKCVR